VSSFMLDKEARMKVILCFVLINKDGLHVRLHMSDIHFDQK